MAVKEPHAGLSQDQPAVGLYKNKSCEWGQMKGRPGQLRR